MKRLAIATGLVLFGSTGVMAANGCPAGSFDTTVSPDAKSYSVLFDNFVAFAGDITTCDIAVPLTGVPKGTIGVYQADYRAFMFLEDVGTESSISIDNSGEDVSEGFVGDVDTDLFYSAIVASNGDSVINSRATVDMSEAVGDDQGGFESAEFVELGRVTLGTDEMAIVTHLGASGELLVGSDGPLEGDDSVSLFGGVGSAMLGATGRFNLGEGLSLLGGVSLIQQGYETSSVSGVVGSVAVRYVQPGVTSFRPFAEAGVTLGGLHTTFADTPNDASTNMLLGSVHLRGGAEMALDDISTVTLGVSAQQSALGVDGYTLTDGGLFNVSMPDQVGHFTKLKASASWRAQITQDVDIEGTGAAGALVAHSDVIADIDGVGTVTAKAPISLFVEYGARVGYNIAPGSRIEGFVQGSTSNDYGTHAQIGAAYRLSF
ncbi:MAG: DUF4360 domain-containing protein [Hyphomicrobiales bacterium]|nr:MAG: DUF4360 domain-containing protein [Hyphomicrobiales bacterium]